MPCVLFTGGTFGQSIGSWSYGGTPRNRVQPHDRVWPLVKLQVRVRIVFPHSHRHSQRRLFPCLPASCITVSIVKTRPTRVGNAERVGASGLKVRGMMRISLTTTLREG